MPTAPALTLADWTVIAVYLALLAGSGWWFSRQRPNGSREYFVGSGAMPVWAVALSVLATTLSAATFIGAPVESYTGDLTYLSTNIGSLVALVVVAGVFLPAFYRAGVTTVYELLERRFGSGTRRATSAAFMLGRVFASGARVYIAAIPLTMVLFHTADPTPGAIVVAIVILCAIASVYCLAGGIRSIIWTDVLQTIVFLLAACSLVWVLLDRLGASLSVVYDTLAATRTPAGTGKLDVLHTGLDLSRPWLGIDLARPYTLLTALVGFSLLMTAAYGTDQDLAQRMLTCKSAIKGSQSAVLAVLIGLPVTALFCVIGLLLHVFYQPTPLLEAAAPPPDNPNDVLTSFVLGHMPAGLRGLMLAGVFAIALTSTMSALNAMSSTLINDFYRPLYPGRDERHYLRASRLGVLGWGVVLAGFASLCVFWQRSSGETLIQFALGVMNFAYSGLLGVYFTALLTRRGTPASAVTALVTGFGVTLALTPGVLKLGCVIAFPWRLFFATLASTLVCASVRSSRPG